MTERDKLEAMAEALDELLLEVQPIQNADNLRAIIQYRLTAAKERALAAQQPVDEPVYVRRDQWEKVRNNPFLCRLSMQPGPDTVALYTHPQARAPADQPKQEWPDYRNSPVTPAGHNDDLDALALLRRNSI